mgnify:CR=1 FL=1
MSGRFCCCYVRWEEGGEREEEEKGRVSFPCRPVFRRRHVLVGVDSTQKQNKTHAPAERVGRVRCLPGEDLVTRLRARSSGSGSGSDDRRALLSGLALGSNRVTEVVGGGSGSSGSGIGSSCSFSSSSSPSSTGVSILATRRRHRHLQCRRARARIVMEAGKQRVEWTM